MSFSIIPTLSNGVGYKTMLDCISRGFHYSNYLTYAKAIPTFVVHADAYHLAQELYNAEIAHQVEDKVWDSWYERNTQ